MSTFNKQRTYHVRDYGPSDLHINPDDYDVVATKLTWEQAQDWVDKNTTDETAGNHSIHADDPPPFYMVCIVLEDKSFGGREEGGWWYDTFNPDDHEAKWLTHEAGGPWLCLNQTEADRRVRWLNNLLKEELVNDQRPDTSSVASRGRYVGHIYEGFPCYLPREVPHYE